MIIEKSKKMMAKNFENIKYKYDTIPEYAFNNNYGIYIHVPFCYSKCSFCPFYKELYNPTIKDMYLKSMLTEIKQKKISGKPAWIYIGGGTPNTLEIDELNSIIEELSNKIELPSIGIELLPSKLSKDYLEGLKNIGINKISIGVESFSEDLMSPSGRRYSTAEHISKLVKYAKKIGLWVSLDLMVGFEGEVEATFLNDIEKALTIRPNQLTTYPLMEIRSVKPISNQIPENRQFELIEYAFKNLLSPSGYNRKTIWTFGIDEEIYDTSRDELIEDYVGFGPASFSTYDKWKVVNPPLYLYLNNIEKSINKGLISEKSPSTDEWRKFASMIYECKCDKSPSFPKLINFMVQLLKMLAYCKNGKLTDKGNILSHSITKKVVESLPFPIQNTNTIVNLFEYDNEVKNSTHIFSRFQSKQSVDYLNS